MQKRSQINSENRAKLLTKHTCGNKSFAEIEESTRDLETGEKARPDQVWLKQHTKVTKDGDLQWSDSKSKEIHEELQQLVMQQTQEGQPQMTNDEILISVLGEKSGYVRGKGAGKKPPTKRTRQDVEEHVQRAVSEVKDSMREEFEEVKNAMRMEFEEKIREVQTEVRAQTQDEIKSHIRAEIQTEFDSMLQERMAVLFNSMQLSKS